MKKRVVIAMSGGVDSSVAAALLKSQGYDCIGVYLNFWSDPVVDARCGRTSQNKCCTKESLDDAREVAGRLNIPLYIFNVEEKFKQEVVDYFLKIYAAGKTPNPCVRCNREIKFGQLLEYAVSLGADYLATGHFARIKKKKNGNCELFEAKDKEKDQSYFLYQLTSEKLRRILFPIGDFKKSEVYRLAKKFGLKRVFEKKESQNVCFFAEKTPEHFLKRHLPEKFFKPGPIVTINGKRIGVHKGLPLYTIGQRKGLHIGGISGEIKNGGWYVICIDRKSNSLVVGRKKDLIKKIFKCKEITFISGKIPTGKIAVDVKIRHRAPKVPSKLEIKNKKGVIISSESFIGVSPGQSAVFYKGEKVIGGGVIEKSKFQNPNVKSTKKSQRGKT
ncbi:tRNA 2-thiouridine(34) synthase MnmA [Candidatus Peregrinibacteria bacterium]|nr:tRNA 2-thiouridine(34) synthase MnmA [Candidatus Peregrinibacteria bacterium]